MKTILILGHEDYGLPFRSSFHIKIAHDLRHSAMCLKHADTPDLILFTGGEDVNPKLYGEEPNGAQYWNDERDRRDEGWFNFAYYNKIPMVGICRGLQFLNVMAGGKLIQHLHHSSPHKICTVDGRELEVNSLHHQGCIPDEEAVVLAKAKEGGLAEAIYFPKINSFGVQWHPEMLNAESEGYIYFQELLRETLDRLE